MDLRDGVRLFNREEFFHCHEVWEDSWRVSIAPQRLFIQSLIHVAVSFYHEQQGNAVGAGRQMRKGLRKLAAYLPEYGELDTGALYRACARRAPGESFPRIRWIAPAVRLRLLRPTDIEPVYRLLSDINVLRYMTFDLHSREEAEEYVRTNGPRVVGPSRSAVDRVIEERHGGMAGLCGLVIDHDCNEAEAWYMILPEQWGRGLATAAMRELLAAGFESHGLDRIWACVVPVNRASSRVLEKAGLRFESETRGTLPVRGEWQDSIQYGISREEWGAVRRSDDCTASGA